MPRPVESIFFEALEEPPVPGWPAGVGEVVCISDNGPGRRLIVRVGATKEAAQLAEPIGLLTVPMVRALVHSLMDQELHPEAPPTLGVELNFMEFQRHWRQRALARGNPAWDPGSRR